jgi:class 3 adenylate cyclase/CHASE2 domain-containing sensor protein
METSETPATELGGDEGALPLVGDDFGDYELIEERGRGGMGAVYRARNRSLGRTVALKILLPHRRQVSAIRKRLRREARALAQLDHHNIVSVYHIGFQGPLEFIEMQYVEGESLLERLRRDPPLGVAAVVRIGEQVAHALAHAHRKGIVHRDIKPANILLTAEALAKVVDFGLARRVTLPSGGSPSSGDPDPGTVCGTPAYMSPEAWSGRAPDPRADQYCLGVTLYHALTGRPPFSGDAAAQMEQHLSETPRPLHRVDPRIPEALSRIVVRLLRKDPDDRYASCEELATELRLVLLPETAVPAPTSLAPSPATEATPREGSGAFHPWIRALLMGGAMAAIVAVGQAGGVFDGLELKSLDTRFAVTRGSSRASPLTLVVADRESKVRLSADRPLSRERHYGELIARLGQARAIGVDLLFTDRAASEEDGGLAAMTSLSPRLVHALNISNQGSAAAGAELPERWALDVRGDGLPEATQVEPPVPEVSVASARVGHLSLAVDPDGTIRRVPHLLRHRGRVYPSLSLAVAMVSLGVDRKGVRRTADSIDLIAPDGKVTRIPVDERGQMLVNFRWTAASIEERSLWRALEVAPGAVEGQVVMVGSGLDGDRDVGPLPARAAAPLVWAHALAVDTILSASYVRETPTPAILGLVVVFALAASLAGGVLSPGAGLGVLIAACAVYWAAAFQVFAGQTRLWLPLVAPSVALAGGYLVPAIARQWTEERQKRALAAALARYLSPSVCRRVLSDPEARRLGGKRKELTILCVEVASFGEVAERLEPEEVEEFLNVFLSTMTEVIFRHEGTLDHFSGQGLRAFFGDPEPQDDHAPRALRCSLEMTTRFQAVLAAWARPGRPSLRIGIGISTGYVTVGNLGSPDRMQYTALGRSADEAALLAHEAAGRILASAKTVALGGNDMRYEPRSFPDGRSIFELLPLRPEGARVGV